MTPSLHLPDPHLLDTKPFSVTPLAVVLKGLTESIRERIPIMSFVFDSTLSYQESARGQRAIRSAFSLEDDQAFPLFGFSRTVLQPIASAPYRATMGSTVRSQTVATSNPEVKDIYAVSGQFDLLFRIYARDVVQLETLELLYSTKAAISDITEFSINIPWLEEAPQTSQVPNWHYSVTWHPLEDFFVQHDPFVTFSLSGHATLNGTFLTGFRRDGCLIDTINLDFFPYRDTAQLLDNIIVSRTNPVTS